MSRNISDLHPRLQVIIPKLKAECEKQGIKISIGECFRTVAEQDALYAKGRTAPGNKVTNARGTSYSSMHQWGVAFDFFLNMDIDGDGETSDDIYNNSKKTFNKVGAIGKSLGLEWGGDWKSPVDTPHFQLPDWGSTPTKLKAQYGTPTKFIATWGSAPASTASSSTTTSKPTTSTTTSSSSSVIKKGSKGTAVKTLQQNLNKVLALSVDGSAGNDTVLGIKYFQKKYGLGADGSYGPASAKKMKALVGSGAAVATVKKGSKGANVKKLQNNLNQVMKLSVDGSAGNATDIAIRWFQEKYGLTVDGSFGPASQKKMKTLL